MKNIYHLVLVTLSACLLLGCAVMMETYRLDDILLPSFAETPEWSPVLPGVDSATATLADPPLAVYCLRIDAALPSVWFYVTPDNGTLPMETSGLKTSTFLKRFDLTIAINASPFYPVDLDEGTPRDIRGISISDGIMYSDMREGFGAFVVYRDRSVDILEQPFDPTEVEQAVSGFHIILHEGKNRGDNKARHPRSAVGISKDKRYVYLMAIDGRQIEHSVGATTEETAAWLAFFGADKGLNLDGGGSTSLVLRDSSGVPAIINRPIHKLTPGQERVVGNHIGIYVRPLCMDFFCQ